MLNDQVDFGHSNVIQKERRSQSFVTPMFVRAMSTQQGRSKVGKYAFTGGPARGTYTWESSADHPTQSGQTYITSII